MAYYGITRIGPEQWIVFDYETTTPLSQHRDRAAAKAEIKRLYAERIKEKRKCIEPDGDRK
jgi:hypothetical protein